MAGTTNAELSALQLEFWTEARDVLAAKGVFPSLQAPAAQNWFDVALGRRNVYLQMFVLFRPRRSVTERRVGVRVVINPDSVAALAQLLAQRTGIESELGFALEWDPHPEKRVRTIRITRSIDVGHRANWPDAIEWLATTGGKVHSVFAPRLKKLSL